MGHIILLSEDADVQPFMILRSVRLSEREVNTFMALLLPMN